MKIPVLNRLSVAIVCLVHALPHAAPLAQAACADVAIRIERAKATNAPEAAAIAWDAAYSNGACPAADLNTMGRAISQMFLVRAQASGQSAEMRIKALQTAIKYGPTWDSLSALADLWRSEGQRLAAGSEATSKAAYAKAAEYYQRSLNDILDKTDNPVPPPRDRIKVIYARAQEMRALSPNHVAAPDLRDGSPGGTNAVDYRGFTPEATLIPVEYEYNKTSFTAKGREAASELVEVLKKLEGVKQVRLVGHTDPIGGHDFNDALSLGRANALKQFLQQNGFKGQVVTEGRGKRQPAAVDDAGQYTEKDLHQIFRRVELVR